MNDRHQFDELFHGLEPPSPPPELRSRALAAGRVEMTSAWTMPGLCTRLWFSTNLRLAWAATVVLLVVAHGVLSLQSPSTVPTSRAVQANRLMAARYNAELAEIVDLPRVGADLYAALESERSNGNDA